MGEAQAQPQVEGQNAAGQEEDCGEANERLKALDTQEKQFLEEVNPIFNPAAKGTGAVATDTIPIQIKPHFFQDKTMPNLLTDYDVIGFDVDNCIAKYNV